jgi:hypothetical protein
VVGCGSCALGVGDGGRLGRAAGAPGDGWRALLPLVMRISAQFENISEFPLTNVGMPSLARGSDGHVCIPRPLVISFRRSA